ncbi:TPR repeat-containing protein [Fimbriiglobus ruber]|uniref:TPR repeat-containing protein n=2 Tax=Fimbriiglobus ruber TaxID=1908690 RepID=A0A225E1E5_9BACT|nr:TPR repeat-containing protein [Fimbriiglobus ruber]
MSAHYERALLLFQQSRYEPAEKELRQVLAADPDDAAAHALLALCLVQLKRFDPATDEAERAVAGAPDVPFSHYALATVRYHRHHYPEAEAAVREAIRLDPAAADYRALLGAILADRENWRGVLAAANAGLECDPAHAGCNNLKAMALVKLGRRVEAGETIEGALARDPDNAFTHANNGWAMLHAGDPTRALVHFREALRLNPDLEFARAGMIEALKARYWVYRQILRYFLWMSRLSPQARWGVVIGLLVGQQAAAAVAKSNPELAPFLEPLLIAYVVFVVTTWTARPLSNLVLRLSRFGRLALSREQRATSNLVGGCVLVSLVGVGIGIVEPAPYDWPGWLMALAFMILLLPLGSIFSCPSGWPRVVMVVYTLVMFLVAVAGVGLFAFGFYLAEREPQTAIGYIRTGATGTITSPFGRTRNSLAWPDGIVPTRTGLMPSQAQLPHLVIRDLQAPLIVSPQQHGFHLQACFGSRVLNIAQQDQPRTQGLAGPVDADKAEQPMLNRVPLGATAGVVAHRHLQVEGVSQPFLQLTLPHPRPTAITATRVRQDQEFGSVRETTATVALPPRDNRIDRKLRRVGRFAHVHVTAVVLYQVDAIRGGPALGVTEEVISVDLVRLVAPGLPILLEVADQLFFLGIHADDRPARFQEPPLLVGDVAELTIPIGVRWAGKPFPIRLQRVLEFVEQTPDGLGVDGMASLGQQLAQSLQAQTHPPLFRHRVAAGVIDQQGYQVSLQDRIFFSKGGRPAPGRRTRPGGRLAKADPNSWRPRRMVWTWRPVMEDTRRSPPWPMRWASQAASQRRCCSLSRLRSKLSCRWTSLLGWSVAWRQSGHRHW